MTTEIRETINSMRSALSMLRGAAGSGPDAAGTEASAELAPGLVVGRAGYQPFAGAGAKLDAERHIATLESLLTQLETQIPTM